MSCKICNKSDLFSEVTGKKVCSVCTLKHLNGNASATDEQIEAARTSLGLAPGEYLKQDNGAIAAEILGRGRGRRRQGFRRRLY